MKKSIKTSIAVTAMTCALALSAGVAAWRSSANREIAPVATQTEMTESAVGVAILKQGAQGGEVKEVQRRLKLWGY